MNTTSITPVAPTLGIQGWEHLDPILLATLTLEAPVLLVERIVVAFNVEFRHYNTPLLKHDDLVGDPTFPLGLDVLRAAARASATAPEAPRRGLARFRQGPHPQTLSSMEGSK